MLKTISAALLAVSVLAAPVLAASPASTTRAPVTKTAQLKPNVRNANAKMYHHRHHHKLHHRFHKRMGALKKHQFTKLSIKHSVAAAKRG
jgi:Ni/Co efflux regulator RcnB